MSEGSSKPITVENFEAFLRWVDHLEQENTQLRAEIAKLKKANKSGISRPPSPTTSDILVVENKDFCRPCLPEECDLFKRGVCRGMKVDGEFAVAKASMRILEKLAQDDSKSSSERKET